MVKVLGLGDNVCDVYLHTGTMYPGGQAVTLRYMPECWEQNRILWEYLERMQ